MARARPAHISPEIDRELERWRGGIDERLDSLANIINDQRQEFREEREETRKHREVLRDYVASNSASMMRLTEQFREISPVVSDLRTRRDQAQGFVWAIRVLWVGLGGAVVYLVQRAWGKI